MYIYIYIQYINRNEIKKQKICTLGYYHSSSSFKVNHALEKISTSIQSKLQKTTIGVIYLVGTRPN